MIRYFSLFILMVSIGACSSKKREPAEMIDLSESKVASKEEMISYLTEWIRKDPRNPDLYLKKAELSLDVNNLSEAVEALNSYEDLEGTGKYALLLKAELSFQERSYHEALKIAEALFQEGFDSIDLHELLYHLYLEAGENLKAIDQINYAIEKNPSNQEYYFFKSTCYIQNLDTSNAIVSLETAINNGYKAIDAIEQYVDLLVDSNDPEKALKAIELGLSLDAGNPGLNTSYARLLKKQGQVGKAKNILFDIIRKDSRTSKAYSALSEVYLSTQMYDSAIFYADRAIQLNPDFFVPYFTKAVVYERRRNFYEALGEYEKVLGKAPENPIALYGSERIRSQIAYNRRLNQRLDSTRKAVSNMPKPIKKSVNRP